MKKILIVLICLSAGASWAQPGPVGLGVIIGSPTGISANFKTGIKNSIDAALAFDLDGDDRLHLHGTYLWHRPKAIPLEKERIGWYYGLGAKLRTHEDRGRDDDDDIRFGPRGSLGLHYPFHSNRFDLFAEIALVMNVIPETDLDLDAGIGGRIYF